MCIMIIMISISIIITTSNVIMIVIVIVSVLPRYLTMKRTSDKRNPKYYAPALV